MTRRRFACLLAAVGILATHATTPAQAADKATYQKALAAYNIGAYTRVATLLGTPQTAADHILLGKSLAALRLDQGINNFSQAARLDHGQPSTMLLLAAAYINLHDYDKALPYTFSALQKDAQSADARAVRGRCLYKLGQEKDGLSMMESALAKAPDSLVCLGQLAFFSEETFDTKKADEYFSRIIKLEPNHVLPLLERAKLYFLAGNEKKALADFDSILAINPDCQMAYLQRATYWKERKNFKNVLADSKKCLACHDTIASVERRAMRLKIDAEERLKQYSEAAKDSQHLNGGTPGLVGSWGGRGDILRQASLQEKLGKYDEALATMDPLYKFAPNRTEVMVTRARILGKSGKFAESLALCNKLIALDANMPDWYRMRARALAGLGKKEAAAQDLAKSKTLGEEFPDLPGLYQDPK